MFKRIAAVIFIFVCTTVAWAILGATIFSRTYDRGPGLREKVVTHWGGEHSQRPPSASYTIRESVVEEVTSGGKTERRTAVKYSSQSVPLESSKIGVTLSLDHRQKGLLWYSTYGVRFSGRYVFRNPSAEAQTVSFSFPFPSAQAIYDDLIFRVDGKQVGVAAVTSEAQCGATVAGNATAVLEVLYRSQGLDNWRYDFGGEVSQVRDFELQARTDFAAIDFPEGTLSPSTKARDGKGWLLTWSYRSMMSGQDIGITMPERLQPGPLAGQISFFAPVSLLFFFFVIFIVTTLQRKDLHPMNYFFLAAAFFAFHLLLAYLVDHISVHAAFVIASAVSIALVVSYLRLVAGFQFAALVAGSAQFVYLVLFSYAFFFKGFTGLAITIGSILTLFVAMQLTGRVKWGESASQPANH